MTNPLNRLPISERCVAAAALLAGLPAGGAEGPGAAGTEAALAAHRATCPTCRAALASLHAELADEGALGDVLAARMAVREAAGRPLAPLRPVVQRTPLAPVPVARRGWLSLLPWQAFAAVAAVLAVLLGGSVFLAGLDSGGGTREAATSLKSASASPAAEQAAQRTAVARAVQPSPSGPADSAVSPAPAAAAPSAAPSPSAVQSPAAVATPAPAAAPVASPAASAPPPPAPIAAPLPPTVPAPSAVPPAAPRATAAATPVAAAPATPAPSVAPSAPPSAPRPATPAPAMPAPSAVAAAVQPPAPSATPVAAAAPAQPTPAAAGAAAPQSVPAPTTVPRPPTPAATAAPTPPPGPPTHILSAPERASPGDSVTVVAQGAPGASCTIDAGPLSLDAGTALSAKTADATGRVSWSWTLGQVSNGIYRVTVTCAGTSDSVLIEIFR